MYLPGGFRLCTVNVDIQADNPNIILALSGAEETGLKAFHSSDSFDQNGWRGKRHWDERTLRLSSLQTDYHPRHN